MAHYQRAGFGDPDEDDEESQNNFEDHRRD
jgi:hypothetical protein